MRDHKRSRPAGNGTAPGSLGGDTGKGTRRPALPAGSSADRFAGRAEFLADVALATGRAAVDDLEGIVAVPDVVRAEGTANGLPDTPTVVLERADGRTVALYRLPAEDGGAA